MFCLRSLIIWLFLRVIVVCGRSLLVIGIIRVMVEVIFLVWLSIGILISKVVGSWGGIWRVWELVICVVGVDCLGFFLCGF